MRTPVLIYYLVLFAFAAAVANFFVNLGQALEKSNRAAQQAIQQEVDVRNRVK